jgi:hypothetical protein
MKGAVAIAARMRQNYAETGKRPEQQIQDALADPALRDALVKGGEVPEPYRALALEERVKAALGEDPRPEIIRSVIAEAAKDKPAGFEQILKETEAIKMDYLLSGEDMTAFSRVVEATFRDEINVQTRGEVSAKQTVLEGMKMMAEGIEPHVIGEGAGPAELAARAFTYRAAQADAMRKLEAQAAKPEAERTVIDNLTVWAAIERSRMAYQHLRGAASESARAVNMMWQLKYRPDLLPEAKALEAVLEKSFKSKKHGETMTFGEIAKLAAVLKDPAQLSRFAQSIERASTGEMIIEGWRAAILSGPDTINANLMGNIGKFLLQVPESIITTTLTAAQRALAGDPMRLAEYKAQAFSPIHGLIWGARDALAMSWEVLKNDPTHFEKADMFKQAIPGKIGTGIRFFFRTLQAGDVLFRVPAERGRAHEIAVTRAIKEGYTPGTHEYVGRVAQYTMQPELGLSARDAAKTLADIQAAGAEAVFAQRLGPFMERIQLAVTGTAAQFIVPFIRTPVNLLSWSVQHSPLFLISKRWRDDFAAGGTRRNQAISRVAVGAGLSLLAMNLFEQGLITGGGHFDKEKRKTKMPGWQPYSIYNPLNKKFYSYQRLEPVSKVIGLIADLMEMQQHEDPDAGKLALASVALFGNLTISTAYLQGLSQLFNAATQPERYWETFAEGYAASLVPKVIAQPVMKLDPHFREVEGVFESIQSQLPYFREKLRPARDVWGDLRERKQALFNLLPIAVTEKTENKVKLEAMKLELALTDVPKFLTIPGPLKPGERRVELTPEQRDIMRIVSGKQAMEWLSPIVNDPAWEHNPEYVKEKVFRRIISAARTQGALKALPPGAPQREATLREMLLEIQRQGEEAAQVVK